MNTGELYEGVNIKIGGKEYIVPGLSLGQVERFADQLEKLAVNGDTLNKEMIQTVARISQAALSRNYPEITVEQVKDMLDMRNMQAVLEAVMGASGFAKMQNQGGNGAQGTSLKRN